jgi:hypothetical protein
MVGFPESALFEGLPHPSHGIIGIEGDCLAAPVGLDSPIDLARPGFGKLVIGEITFLKTAFEKISHIRTVFRRQGQRLLSDRVTCRHGSVPVPGFGCPIISAVRQA